MSTDDHLRGSCSCGRYNYIVQIPGDASARNQAHVHFGTGGLDRQSHASLLSAWLKVPLAWYQSATVSFFPDERHDLIARTFTPLQQPSCQRKFCGFCGTHISYWTEEMNEQDFMNITLGSLRERDLLALEDLDLLPEEVDIQQEGSHQPGRPTQAASGTSGPTESTALTAPDETGMTRSSRSGTTGGISWFEDMINGSQLGHHSKRRKGHGTSADGTTTISWEVSEYYGSDDAGVQTPSSSKRKAGDIETDDTPMKG